MKLFLLFILFSCFAHAEEGSDPYWEYGVGVGYTQFSQYPSSNQSRNFLVAFPTFQYRGEILRADDRDGAHAYLLKSKSWTLEMAGTAYAPVDSSKVEARKDMQNLPFMIALGPRILSKWSSDFQFGLGAFQNLAMDLRKTETRGQIFEAHVSYRWEENLNHPFFKNFDQSFGKISLSAKAATREFLGTYFDVTDRDVTALRPRYDSRAGYLDHEVTYFQYVKKGFAAFYVGLSYSDFSWSANRQSPLHRANHTFSYLAGFTYVLGQSSKKEVPEEDTSGLLNKYRSNGPF